MRVGTSPVPEPSSQEAGLMSIQAMCEMLMKIFGDRMDKMDKDGKEQMDKMDEGYTVRKDKIGEEMKK